MWRKFFYDISFMANVPIREIKSNLTEAIKTEVFQELRDCFNLSSINLFNKRNNDIKSFFSLDDIQLRIILVSIIIEESKILQEYIRRLAESDRRKAISRMVETSNKIVTAELLSSSKLKSLQILDNENFVSKDIKEYIMGLSESFVTKIIKYLFNKVICQRLYAESRSEFCKFFWIFFKISYCFLKWNNSTYIFPFFIRKVF